MPSFNNAVTITLPNWLIEYRCSYQVSSDEHAQMAFVIEAARQNVQQQTGGPFAAAVFCEKSGKLIALGVNQVLREHSAIAHAEVLALTLAQQQYNRFSLHSKHKHYRLVTSCEPCAMCLGAICWSGVSSLICAATTNDAQAIGFDEGPIKTDWQSELAQRHIKVKTKVLRDEGRSVLISYGENSGTIYNA